MKQLYLVLCCVFVSALANGQAVSQYKFNGEQGVFTENQGQVTDGQGLPVPDVLAKASMPGLDVYLTKTGVTYFLLQYEEDLTAPRHPVFVNDKKYKIKYSRVDVALTGATLGHSQMQWSGEAGWKTNYYKTADGKGQEAISHYSAVTIQNVYPGIDWVWKFNSTGTLEYDFVVHPGADPSAIKMQYSYADLKQANNNLTISTRTGGLIEGPLQASSNNHKIQIAYTVDAAQKQVSFNATGYDKTQDLLIDPPLALDWSAEFGGSFLNGLRGVATDNSGGVYLCGYTTSPNFITHNPGGGAYFNGTYDGQSDAILLKVDTNQNLKWATYMGGPGNDFANSVCYAPYSNRIYVTGGAETGFPVGGGGTGNHGGQDMFASAFNLSNLSLQYSSFYGGTGTDEGMKICVNNLSQCYIVGYTNSTNGSFATLGSGGGYLQTTVTGVEAFIMGFTDYNNTYPFYTSWCTMYGGSGSDYATSVTTDTLNNIVVTGFTNSTNIPLMHGNSAYYQSTNGGGNDGFILKFNSNTSLSASTYYGGSKDDYFIDVTTGIHGNFIFTGRTNSPNFPLLAIGGLGYNQAHLADTSDDAFLVKCDNNTKLQWATYYGGNAVDAGTGVSTDSSGHIYITGFTFSNNFPVRNYPGAFYQGANLGNSDGFIGQFSDLGVMDWSTYDGDSCYQYPYSINYNKKFNRFYVVGEGLLACGQSLPDTGQVMNGVSSVGFCWAFGGQNTPPNQTCAFFDVGGTFTKQPCPGQCNGTALIGVGNWHGYVHYVWPTGDTTVPVTNPVVTINNLCAYSWIEAQDSVGCNAETELYFTPITLAPSLTPIVCNPGPGSISANPSEGNIGGAPYVYEWSTSPGLFSDSNTIYVTDTGSYSVTVTDGASCTVSANVEVPYNNISPQGLIEVINYPSCNDSNGVVTLDNFNTDSIYPHGNIIWTDQNYNEIVAGDTFYDAGTNNTYFAVDSAFCYNGVTSPVYYQFNLQNSTNLAQVQINTPSSCISNDGSAYVWFSGQSFSFMGNNTNGFVWNSSITVDYYPDTYLWSNGDTGISAYDLGLGTYTVTVTDSLCTTVLSFISTLPSPTAQATIYDSAYCAGGYGGVFAVVPSGGNGGPYTFSVNNGPLYSGPSFSTQGSPAGTYTVIIDDQLSCADTISVVMPQGTPLSITTSVTPPLCAGGDGSVVVNGSAGVPPYTGTGTYLYPQGTYNFTITDADGCSATGSVTVGAAPPLLVVTANLIAPALCPGSSATYQVTATGGTQPYSGTGTVYEPVGTDVITVTDANGCAGSATVVVTAQGTPIVPQNQFNPILCYGDSTVVTITATGGQAPYTGTGTFTLAAGNYAFTITDNNGCTATDYVTITQPQQVLVNLNSAGITCAPGTITATVPGGGGPYQYQWSTSPGLGDSASIYVGVAGSYDVTVQDANLCSAIGSINVNYNNLPLNSDSVIILQYPACGLNNGVVYIKSPEPANITWTLPNGTIVYGDTLYNAPVDTNWGFDDVLITDSSICVNGLPAAVQYNLDITPELANDMIPYPFLSFEESYNPSGCNTKDGYILNIANNWAQVEDLQGNYVSNFRIINPSPLIYHWSNGITDTISNNTINGNSYYTGIDSLSSGIYYLTVTNGTCHAIDTAVLTPTNPPLAVSYSVTSATCNSDSNGAINLTGEAHNLPNAFGDTTNTFAWSNNATTASISNVPAGVYTVTITGPNACPVIDTVNVAATSGFPISLNSAGITCAPGTITATVQNGAGPYQYQWSTSPGYGESASIFVSDSGVYAVTVEYAVGCSATASVNVVFNNSSIVYDTINVLYYPACGLSNGIIAISPPNQNITWTLPNGTIEYGDTIFNVPTEDDASSNPNNDTNYILVTDNSNCLYGQPYPVQYRVELNPVSWSFYGWQQNPTGCNTQDGLIDYWPDPYFSCLVLLLVNGQPNYNYYVNYTISNAPTVTMQWSTGYSVIDSVFPYLYQSVLYNLNPGTYYVTVSDGICQTVDSVVLIDTTPPLKATYTITGPGCNGGNGSLTLAGETHDLPNSSGDSTNTFAWSNNSTTASLSNVQPGVYSVTITGPNACPVIDTFTVPSNITNPLIVSNTIVSPRCYGGVDTLTITATGGTSPYTGTGTFMEAPGSYILPVSDLSGCSVNDTVVVPPSLAQSALTVNNIVAPVPCHGSQTTVTISASGGVSPYTGTGNYFKYAGTYTFVVTDSLGCTDSDIVVINQPGILLITNDVIPVACNGGNATITLSCTGGTSPYTGTGTFVRPSGNYVFVLTDANGCTTNDSIDVFNPPVFTVTGTITQPVKCYGADATIQLNASGGVWPYFGAGTVTRPAGNYQLVVTDETGCVDSVAVNVTQPTALVLDITALNTKPCMDSLTVAVSATGGTGAYTGTGDITYRHNGTYTISVTDANGCTADSVLTVQLDTCTGIANVTTGTGVLVYPNPAADQFYVKFETPLLTETNVRLYAADGKLVFVKTLGAGQDLGEVDCHMLASGVYILRTFAGGRDYYFKVVVER